MDSPDHESGDHGLLFTELARTWPTPLLVWCCDCDGGIAVHGGLMTDWQFKMLMLGAGTLLGSQVVMWLGAMVFWWWTGRLG